MRRLPALRATLLGALLIGVLPGPAGATAGTEVTAWQGGPLHDGFSAEETFVPPLTKAWEVPAAEARTRPRRRRSGLRRQH